MRSCINVNIITILIFPVATATPSVPTPTTKPARLQVGYFFMSETNEKRPCLLGTTLRTFHLNHLIFNINDDHVIFPSSRAQSIRSEGVLYISDETKTKHFSR